jgi:nitroimidazol reductase NimA-like FMN-containing flavoprotein (pyridoxamine 5'-phosphate oxidase superfamily)
MPGYGIATNANGLLPWEWARRRLEEAHNYFVTTVRPDGRPHCMPVWAVWMDERLIFSTGADSRKARNLAANPRCVVAPESAAEAVIVEGAAHEEHDTDLLRRWRAAYKLKYDWDMDATEGIFTVVPDRAFGFEEADDTFGVSATRWLF